MSFPSVSVDKKTDEENPWVKILDKISDLQQSIDCIKRTQVQTESLRYGGLAASAFGLPETFVLTRENKIRKDGHCDMLLSAAILHCNFNCSSWSDEGCCKKIGFGDTWADDLPETMEYYKSLQDQYHPMTRDGYQDFLTTKEAKVDSVHEMLFQEAFERQLRRNLPSGWCLNLLEECDSSFTVSLIAPMLLNWPVDLPFSAFMDIVKIICSVHHPAQKCWKSVKVEECNWSALQLFHLTNPLEAPEKVKLARRLFNSLPDRYMSDVGLWSVEDEALFIKSLSLKG